MVKIQNDNTKIKKIENIETKPTLLDKTKIIVNKDEFDDIKLLAKKHLTSQEKEKNLLAKIKDLESKNKSMDAELFEYKSIKKKLTIAQLEADILNTRRKLVNIMFFVNSEGLGDKLERFLKQKTEKER